jgi:hypothetical protein
MRGRESHMAIRYKQMMASVSPEQNATARAESGQRIKVGCLVMSRVNRSREHPPVISERSAHMASARKNRAHDGASSLNATTIMATHKRGVAKMEQVLSLDTAQTNDNARPISRQYDGRSVRHFRTTAATAVPSVPSAWQQLSSRYKSTWCTCTPQRERIAQIGSWSLPTWLSKRVEYCSGSVGGRERSY